MIFALYRIRWTDYERGWEKSGGGETYHLTLEDANRTIKEYWAGMPDEVPDFYSKPEKPELVEVSEELYKKIQEVLI